LGLRNKSHTTSSWKHVYDREANAIERNTSFGHHKRIKLLSKTYLHLTWSISGALKFIHYSDCIYMSGDEMPIQGLPYLEWELYIKHITLLLFSVIGLWKTLFHHKKRILLIITWLHCHTCTIMCYALSYDHLSAFWSPEQKPSSFSLKNLASMCHKSGKHPYTLLQTKTDLSIEKSISRGRERDKNN